MPRLSHRWATRDRERTPRAVRWLVALAGKIGGWKARLWAFWKLKRWRLRR